MRQHGHGTEEVGLLGVGIIARLCGSLGLIEGQCHLIDREALAADTEVLMPGQADLL